MFDFIRARIAAAALAAASSLLVLKWFLPGFFDTIADLITLGLIWAVGYFQPKGPKK